MKKRTFESKFINGGLGEVAKFLNSIEDALDLRIEATETLGLNTSVTYSYIPKPVDPYDPDFEQHRKL